jgi:hypothetical protein
VDHPQSEGIRRLLRLPDLGLDESRVIVRVDEYSHSSRSGQQLAQDLKPLRLYLNVQCRYAGKIGARSAQAGDKSIFDRVAAGQEDDRDSRGLRLCGQSGDTVTAGCDHVHPTANQIGRQRRQPVVLTIGPAVFDRYSPILDVARLIQAKAERAGDMCKVVRRRRIKKTNYWQCRLLRACGERPSGRSAK